MARNVRFEPRVKKSAPKVKRKSKRTPRKVKPIRKDGDLVVNTVSARSEPETLDQIIERRHAELRARVALQEFKQRKLVNRNLLAVWAMFTLALIYLAVEMIL